MELAQMYNMKSINRSRQTNLRMRYTRLLIPTNYLEICLKIFP